MRIAKSAKRLLSALTVTTLLVSGIVVAPKAKAAEGDPAVKVLGATLKKTEGVMDKSKVRIAVEVSNASTAKKCGMSINFGEKQIAISTDTHKKIYSMNKDLDKVVYTAVITNVPDTYYDKTIAITGSVTPLEGEEVTTATPVEKTIDGIATAIGSGEYTDSFELPKVTSFDTETDIYAGQYAALDNVTYTVGDVSPAKIELAYTATDGANINWAIWGTVNGKKVGNAYYPGTARTATCDLTQGNLGYQCDDRLGNNIPKGTTITIESSAGESNQTRAFKFTSVKIYDAQDNLLEDVDVSAKKGYAPTEFGAYKEILRTGVIAPYLQGEKVGDYKKIKITLKVEKKDDSQGVNVVVLYKDGTDTPLVTYDKSTETVTFDIPAKISELENDNKQSEADKLKNADVGDISIKLFSHSVKFKGKVTIQDITLEK